MARRDPDGISFCHQRTPLRHTQQKLLDVGEAVIRSRELASPLRERLAAVVWQLPVFLKKDMQRLEKFVETLRHWKTTRHAIEFRHKSWFDDEIAPMPRTPCGYSLYVRCPGLADVGGSDDRLRLCLVARSHPEIRIELQQSCADKMGRRASSVG